MARRIREHDWAATSLGPIDAWSERLRAVLDLLLASGMPMVALWGPDLIQLYNDGYREIMAGKHPAGLGMPTRECWPEVWSINAPIYDRVRIGETVTFEDALYPIARRGVLEDAWFTLSYSPLRDEVGAVAGVLVTVYETTRRVLAERARRASEEQFREALEIETVGVAFYDEQGWLVDATPAFLRLTGLTREQIVSGALHWHDVTAREWWPATRSVFAGLVAGARVAPHEKEYLRQGAPSWWGLAAAKRLEGGHIVEFVLDVTARRRAEQSWRNSRASLAAQVAVATAGLRALSRRLLTVQEEERRHLARELHDEIGQALTGLALQLGTGDTVDSARLAEARRIAAELTAQVRRLSMDLRPAALDAYGLRPALLWHVERYQIQTGVQVDLRHEGLERRFPAPVEIAAYRIVQEALTNVARHAGVDRVLVQLLADDAVLTVSVRDEGRGFDPLDPGGGLSGMRERAELIGGTLTVDAALGAGVAVTAELPIGEDDPPMGTP